MGANFQEFQLPQESKESARLQFGKMQDEDRYENGHGAYSGGVGTCAGLAFHEKEFDTIEEARDYVEERAEKWGNAVAVRVKGRGGWFVGAWCAE